MAIKITEDCINCGACEPECPNTAIYEAAYDWKYSDGTSLIGDVILQMEKMLMQIQNKSLFQMSFILL